MEKEERRLYPPNLPTETANMRTLCTKERGEQDNQACPDTSQAEGQF